MLFLGLDRDRFVLFFLSGPCSAWRNFRINQGIMSKAKEKESVAGRSGERSEDQGFLLGLRSGDPGWRLQPRLA